MKTFSLICRALVSLRAGWFGLFLALSVAGCATGQAGSIVNHSFAFNAWKDSPGIEVLAYRYGNGFGTRFQATETDTKNGETFQSTNITGNITVGKDLYVKWRIKKTGEVFEDNVDLQKQWPRSMDDRRIYFIVQDRQLYVYLITLLNERPYFKPELEVEMNRFSNSTPRTKALKMYARSYIDLIYPEHQLDPHLPRELRRK
jgi:hypothetical protein